MDGIDPGDGIQCRRGCGLQVVTKVESFKGYGGVYDAVYDLECGHAVFDESASMQAVQ
jgi:hypothetical protein